MDIASENTGSTLKPSKQNSDKSGNESLIFWYREPRSKGKIIVVTLILIALLM